MLKKLISFGTVALVLVGHVSGIDTNGWIKQDKADGSSVIKVTLHVKQSNLDVVDKLFWEVSNPKSSMYGQYLSFNEVGDLVRNEKGTNAALAYLKALGVPAENINTDPHGTIITAKVPVALANKAFGADFHVFSHPESKEYIVKTEESSIPFALKDHIAHVPHVSYFPDINQKVTFSPKIEIQDDAAAAQGFVTPSVLYQYYGIDNSQVQHGATQSVYEGLGQQFDNTDLNSFQRKNNLILHNITSIVGANDPNQCFSPTGKCGEANLDVQYLTAIAQGGQTVYWSMSTTSHNPFMDWVEQISNVANPPQVHSISYSNYESGNSINNMNLFNTMLQKLALRGVSVLASSGDDGTAGFKARNNGSQCGYHAQFPASSPYVTAVGATKGPESGTAEVVCSSDARGGITSGGGFSNSFARQSYQNNAVASYFRNVQTTPANGYNANGRGYPDVSAMGFAYQIFNGGQTKLESGTSASTPVFAGMITLINDARLAQGKHALGFLNQALYQLDSSVWTDVVTGNNKCTANKQICCVAGFFASRGWDPVTGLGTPKFQALKKALLAL